MKKLVLVAALFMFVCGGSFVANAQDPEEPKAEEPKAEEPKAEAPANGTPATETPAQPAE